MGGFGNSRPAYAFCGKRSGLVPLCWLALTSCLRALPSLWPGCSSLSSSGLKVLPASLFLWAPCTLWRESAPGYLLARGHLWVLELPHPGPQPWHTVLLGRGFQAFYLDSQDLSECLEAGGATCLTPHLQSTRVYCRYGTWSPSSISGQRWEGGREDFPGSPPAGLSLPCQPSLLVKQAYASFSPSSFLSSSFFSFPSPLPPFSVFLLYC